ncbi:MAG: alpha-L-fucosidase [Christensenellaceae bacterium]|nr:alpha-L-fucosidase [Christensenellaceae bacterium]MEA5064879.1 alpha-L-fucosidase [Eubacteriales bacterium]MEA5068695.1 alpha-L-fucosidase [Christensenellaceae bacterium]
MENRMSWWRDAKFGLFIHWGLYALLAGEYRGVRTDNIAEWIMHDLGISAQEYEKLASRFNPDSFDADRIARLARDTGMKYVVLTAKHHEGFAMYRSKADPYNVVDATPWGRDPARALREACDRYGLKLCFYYSQAQDWHHPDGIEEGVPDEGKDFRNYLDRKCIPQITELLTEYGDVGLIWFDTPMSMTKAQSEELKALVRRLQPDCLISGRIGNGLGDYMTTGDNFIPLLPYPGDFEVPATINDTWGFSRFDRRWKSPEKLIRNLVKVVSRGGNFLLNIGPDAAGRVPEACERVLGVIGGFLARCGESIYGTRPVPAYPYDIDWGYFTSRPGKLYIHVFEEMPDVYLLNMANTPKRAYLLSDGRELTLKERVTCEGDHSWRILWPGEQPKDIDTVICVEIEEDQVAFEAIKG